MVTSTKRRIWRVAVFACAGASSALTACPEFGTAEQDPDAGLTSEAGNIAREADDGADGSSLAIPDRPST